MAPTPEALRRQVYEVVQRHGWNATAFQTLGEGYRYFFHRDGVVAYVDTGAAWVVAGAPIGPFEQVLEIAQAFLSAAKSAGKRCCFFGTEERFVQASTVQMRSFRIGEQPLWNPKKWVEILAGTGSLREQLRRARAKGAVVRVLGPGEGPAPTLVEGWLATRGMPPMRFLANPASISFSSESTPHIFVAEREGRLVGLSTVIPVPLRRGWFIEQLVRGPRAPNGIPELLVDAVMRWAAEAGSEWLTLGLAPLSGEIAPALRMVRRRTRLLYDFDGLRRFKAKLRPAEWQPLFVTRPTEQSAVLTIVDVLAAFAGEGLLRFGARAVARGPSVVLAALALLLVPWILLLAAAPSASWFAGHSAVKWGWVLFDVVVVAGLGQLLRRPSRRLATVLALAVTGDAVATFTEAVLWNLPRLRGWPDAAVVLVACLAPTFAAFVLWGTRKRLSGIEGG